MGRLRKGHQLSTFTGHCASVNSITVDSRRGLLLSGAGDRVVREWDMETGRTRSICEEKHENTISSVAVLDVEETNRFFL